ncbi:hypothetical protein [Shewanella phaeophyticola]|uniref:Uncharacterized protein n=1 Tax=Shewanella phaeophyticola TaxID=2978345 RepID=A0ABT2P1V8_9GAMM|nr:hypothetical protein [Shewanella sp. KJ10-1]MCT8986637.1 hypothetical protein [Shewanella sp. KJ10-1]
MLSIDGAVKMGCCIGVSETLAIMGKFMVSGGATFAVVWVNSTVSIFGDLGCSTSGKVIAKVAGLLLINRCEGL